MVTAQIELTLWVTGLATAGAVVMFLAPAVSMKLLFGRASPDPVGLMIARHWGLLIFLVGGLLIYAAQNAEIRVPVLVVAIAEKAAFALVVFVSPIRRYRTAFAVAMADGSMALVYIAYLSGL